MEIDRIVGAMMDDDDDAFRFVLWTTVFHVEIEI